LVCFNPFAYLPIQPYKVCESIKERSYRRPNVGQVKRTLGYRIPAVDEEVDELARERLDRLNEELRRSNRSRRDGEALIERTALAEDSVMGKRDDETA
jgi:hypothetical protein